MQKQFVVIAGNIGVGKSTLVARLAQQWGWQAAHEPNAANPYLADFYQDMARWGFHSQIFFLGKRLEQHNTICSGISRGDLSVLQDRSVYEDAEIFARNLFNQGHISPRDWQTYYDLYQTMAQIIQPPNLVVYLRASVDTLSQRVAQRNRDYERHIPREYLAQVNALYDDWAARFTRSPLITIEADTLNWANGSGDLEVVAEKIRRCLNLDLQKG
jgi:deoxyadenosine/deoxycytidine kinase